MKRSSQPPEAAVATFSLPCPECPGNIRLCFAETLLFKTIALHTGRPYAPEDFLPGAVPARSPLERLSFARALIRIVSNAKAALPRTCPDCQSRKRTPGSCN